MPDCDDGDAGLRKASAFSDPPYTAPLLGGQGNLQIGVSDHRSIST